MQEELDYLRALVRSELRAFARCPQCDYEVEVDPGELFRLSGKPDSHCLNCWSELELSVSAKGQDLQRETPGDSILVASGDKAMTDA